LSAVPRGGTADNLRAGRVSDVGARLRRLKRRVRRKVRHRIPRRLRSIEREQVGQLAWMILALVLGAAVTAGIIYLTMRPELLVPGVNR
jgi:hypothetical protein